MKLLNKLLGADLHILLLQLMAVLVRVVILTVVIVFMSVRRAESKPAVALKPEQSHLLVAELTPVAHSRDPLGALFWRDLGFASQLHPFLRSFNLLNWSVF